jgi:hypothetical protein
MSTAELSWIRAEKKNGKSAPKEEAMAKLI